MMPVVWPPGGGGGISDATRSRSGPVTLRIAGVIAGGERGACGEGGGEAVPCVLPCVLPWAPMPMLTCALAALAALVARMG